MTDLPRAEHLDHLVNRRYLTGEGSPAAYHGDGQHRWQIEQLRQMLVVTDAAMRAEGFPQDARDRVVFRLLHGEPPETAYGEIDWRAAHKRSVERSEEILRLAHQDPNLLNLIPGGWLKEHGEKW